MSLRSKNPHPRELLLESDRKKKKRVRTGYRGLSDVVSALCEFPAPQ